MEYWRIKLERYEDVRKRMFIRLRNADQRADELRELPHERILDLAVTCHVFLGQSVHGFVSCAVTESMRQQFGVSVSELVRDASASAASLCGYLIRPMSEMAAGLAGGELIFYPENVPEMFVVTNRSMLYGAAAIFYPGAAQELASRLQESYFLLPSSIHEMIAVPAAGQDPSELGSMVREINRTVVEDSDRLSDHVYYYDAETGSFVIAD